jgi:antitoxin component of RelBE/YafQ-DinJ toxin-antitoxin module
MYSKMPNSFKSEKIIEILAHIDNGEIEKAKQAIKNQIVLAENEDEEETVEQQEESAEIDDLEEKEVYDETDKEVIVVDPTLFKKIDTLITALEIFFTAFIKKTKLPTDVKNRESNKEILATLMKQKSILERAFTFLENALSEFKGFEITKEESEDLVKKLKLYKILLYTPEDSPTK